MSEVEIAKIDLVITNRALARLKAVDAYGHVSIRHPTDPSKFLLSRSLSPELVQREDIMIFGLDGEKADKGDNRNPYLERFIHAAVFAARPDINAVVHGHPQAVLPFTVTEQPMKIIYFSGNEFGPEVRTWDIADEFGDTNVLIANMAQGRALAKALGQNRTLLLRGHGFVGAAKSAINMIRLCKALLINAQMLIDAIRIGGPIKEMRPGELALRDAEVGQERAYATFRGFEYEARMAGLDELLKERVELAKVVGGEGASRG